jgi:hypothetical protein
VKEYAEPRIALIFAGVSSSARLSGMVSRNLLQEAKAKAAAAIESIILVVFIFIPPVIKFQP